MFYQAFSEPWAELAVFVSLPLHISSETLVHSPGPIYASAQETENLISPEPPFIWCITKRGTQAWDGIWKLDKFLIQDLWRLCIEPSNPVYPTNPLLSSTSISVDLPHTFLFSRSSWRSDLPVYISMLFSHQATCPAREHCHLPPKIFLVNSNSNFKQFSRFKFFEP